MQINRESLLKLEKEEIIDILLAIISQQAAQIIELTARIAELEARLNQNSQNSSKPPSSDMFKKPKPKSLRVSSGKKAGGQKGHEGSGLKLTQEADQVVTHEPDKCAQCSNASLCGANRRVAETRNVIDIEVKPIVTAHCAVEVVCPQDGEVYMGSFPIGVTGPMQYGVNLEALVVSLNTAGMVSINRTHEILSDVFGIPISTGTIAAMVKGCAACVGGTVDEIKEAILEEPIIGFDETGTRIDKKNHWAHVASTQGLTYISVQEKRGRKGIEAAGIAPFFKGIGVHDCWAAYFSYLFIHALCCAHLLRELADVFENYKQEWAKNLIDLLVQMKRAKEDLMGIGILQMPKLMWEKYSKAYDEIVACALAVNPIPEKDPKKRGKPKRGKPGALADRLMLRKAEYFMFITNFDVPFDNNQSERDFRMFKVKQKVSGCFRTINGAKDFAKIMSFTSTARKRGLSAFLAIKDALLFKPFKIKQISF